MNDNRETKEDKIELKNEEFDIREIYTPFSIAKEEIWKRWNDNSLREKVEHFLGGDMPSPFKDEPRAVLSRNIITPNTEFFYFLDLAKNIGLRPVGLEGIEDKFCTKNFDKVSLGKLSFYRDIENKNLESEKSIIKIIDMMAADGKRLYDINTLWGEKLMDFHHRMLALNDAKIELFDDFRWLASQNRRNTSNQYYDNFLLFFLCHGILFENFHARGKEESFTSNIVVESYKKIKDVFKCKPLIVPLVPIDDERGLHYWNSYLSK